MGDTIDITKSADGAGCASSMSDNVAKGDFINEPNHDLNDQNSIINSKLVGDVISDNKTSTSLNDIEKSDFSQNLEQDEQKSSEDLIVDRQADENVSNLSTQVLLDASLSDRLSKLDLEDDKQQQGNKTDFEPPLHTNSNTKVTELFNSEGNHQNNHTESNSVPSKPDEISNSQSVDQLSNHSIGSLDMEQEVSEHASNKAPNSNDSDQDMSIADQDEDVEEEEEFHELEEDKLRTSQESVQSDKVLSSTKSPIKESVPSKPDKSSEDQAEPSEIKSEFPIKETSNSNETRPLSKTADWVDIMCSNDEQSGEGKTDSTGDPSDANDEKKVLDLDEDVKNPQYIPKKGVFYEHDDRLNEEAKPTSSSSKKDEITESKEATNTKKINNQERQNERRGNRRHRSELDRWDHDRFRYDQQKPKGKPENSELSNDVRPERQHRGQGEHRGHKGLGGNIINSSERSQGGQDNLRPRMNRDNRPQRQGQPQPNRVNDRRSRRQPNKGRLDAPTVQTNKRDHQNSRLSKPESKDFKTENTDMKQQNLQVQTNPIPQRRDQDSERTMRAEVRGRRQNSKDRPLNSDDKFPPVNTVMPPMTTWSNKIEDMVKEDANKSDSSPSRSNQHSQGNSNIKGRLNDAWPSNNQSNRGSYHERSIKTDDASGRQQHHYNTRKYTDREDGMKPSHFTNRNQYSDRSNQHHQEWRRTGHYNPHIKSNDYGPIKTQTFENSRLSQANSNRTGIRDAREIIDRKMQSQQQQQGNFPQHQHKVHSTLVDQQIHPQQQQQHQRPIQHQPMMQPHQHTPLVQQQVPQHMTRPHLPPNPVLQQTSGTNHHHGSQQHQSPQPQHHPQPQQQPMTRQQHQPTNSQSHQVPPRQNIVMPNMSDGVQDQPNRSNSGTSASNDLMNTRPIVKADAYSGSNMAANHNQQGQPIQHSQNHRSMGGPAAPAGGSHMVPTHLDTSGHQAQYYNPSNSSRDPATAALSAPAYHGYMPSGHSVIDTTRYHMAPQQIPDHGYMTSPGQNNDVGSGGSVIHQQGMYNDATSAGGTVASSAYLAAQAGSTMSPSTNIPVTGAGPPLGPYIQHSQYPPPPYSNPYNQPQLNQAPPPQSNHGYPYWYL